MNEAAEFARYGRPPPPRANWLLFGHEQAEQELLTLSRDGRLPHALLLTGPAGIGKATLAFRFARFLLVEGGSSENTGAGLLALPRPAVAAGGLFVAPDHPVARRVASGGHADLLTVERAFDEKRGRVRSSVSVDDIRRIPHFLASTAAEGCWRVVVIDGADAMTDSAANALLKVLEEPPAMSLLMLTAETASTLPATVRSRCRRLRLAGPPDDTVTRLLRLYRPDLPAAEAEQVCALAAGRIGRALALSDGDALQVRGQLHAVLQKLPAVNRAELHRLCERLGAAGNEAAFGEAATVLRDFLADVITTGAGRQVDSRGDAASVRLARAAPLDHWLEVWDKSNELLARADTAYLDRKQVLLAVFFQLIGVRSEPRDAADGIASC
jgi:DNA polymerase-3 subunit delta'